MPRRVAALGIVAVLAVSLVLRFLELDRLPGINADEAFFPVQIQRALAGEPFTLRAPTGLFADPLTVLSHAAFLLVLPPSFWLLRLPVALWALAGLAITFGLHARLHGSRLEAGLVAALTACLPLHLAYSRCGWVPSLMLATAPLVWYTAQEIAQGRGGKRSAALLAVGALLCLSVHLTAGAFLAAVGISMLWTRRDAVRGRAAVHLGIGALSAAAFVALAAAARFPLGRAREAAAEAATLLLHPLDALAYVALAGRFLSGSRAYAYFAGAPPTAVDDVLALAALLAALACAVRLCRSPSAADRFTGVFWLLVPFLLIATKGLTRLDVDGRERYVLWLLVAFPGLLVRGIGGAKAAPIVLALCALLLAQTWSGYFRPLRTQEGAAADRLHPTFWTGEVEPKAEAARRIRELAGRPDSLVYAEDFWIQYPLQFALGPVPDGREVRTRIPQAALSSAHEWFAVGFAGSPFTEAVRRALADAGRPFEEIAILGSGRPVLTVLHAFEK